MQISKNFTFDSAHRLTGVPEGHKCSRLHGHTFLLEVHLHGDIDPVNGFVLDFGDITEVVAPLLEQLDHAYLNDIEGLENPTSENIARWIWSRLIRSLPGLCKIVIKETPNVGCCYEGE